ncbi:general secretion pathway protein GspB [Salinisphaera sp. SPP-AMP-43]|uniref:general secretion pathway protein GspB n=1 Tax=Salinisphaera sp. SPP-AMP-43 TaxID=3121288 RepID=UPI003C6E8ACB
MTYSKTPLTDGASATAPAAASATTAARSELPDQSRVGEAPSVTINGQLYSTVPGRSFILVRGRRYHEGERLAAGPAVESIGPNGATLIYKGERYHVAGPG